MLKKILILFLTLLIFSFSITVRAVVKPKITSRAYVLYNPDNNQVVESVNGDAKMYPASLTKMLTALVAYEMCEDLDNETAVVSENAIKSIYGTGSSTAGLQIGEEVTLRQLLYLLMMPSGNDAANVIAEYFCGNNQTFAREMNRKAKEIGMVNSHFANPHGLHDNNHYTTAKDLAILADAYSEVDTLYKIANTLQFVMPATNKQPEREIKTTNFLMIDGSGYYYQYADGLKTGNTDKAGRCLAASAEKDGLRFICILLDCPEVWQGKNYIRSEFLEAAEVFKYAFENFEYVKIAEKGTKLGENSVYETFNKKVDVLLSDDVFSIIPNGTDLSKLKIVYNLNNLDDDNLLMPNVTKGEKLGTAELYLDGNPLAKTTVVSGNTVKSNWWLKFWHTIDFYVYLVVAILCSIIVLFVVLIIRKYVIINRRRREKQKRIEKRKRLQAEFDAKQPYDYFKID